MPGPVTGRDNTTINAAGGELILNRRQQQNLFEAINQGDIGGGGEVNVNIQGDFFGDEAFVDRLTDNINEGIEERNLQLRA